LNIYFFISFFYIVYYKKINKMCHCGFKFCIENMISSFIVPVVDWYKKAEDVGILLGLENGKFIKINII
jgi:hypothetical protein